MGARAYSTGPAVMPAPSRETGEQPEALQSRAVRAGCARVHSAITIMAANRERILRVGRKASEASVAVAAAVVSVGGAEVPTVAEDGVSLND